MQDTNGATSKKKSLSRNDSTTQRQEKDEDRNEAIVLSRVVIEEKTIHSTITSFRHESIPIHPPSLPSAHLFFCLINSPKFSLPFFFLTHRDDAGIISGIRHRNSSSKSPHRMSEILSRRNKRQKEINDAQLARLQKSGRQALEEMHSSSSSSSSRGGV